MTYANVNPIWTALRDRFQKTAEEIPAQDIDLQIGTSSVRSLLHHTAEVEYMFAEWFFDKKIPVEIGMAEEASHAQLIEQLSASNENLMVAMEALPEDQWQVVVESRMGPSTPLEAVGRLMYHTGMHAGQISLIRKNGQLADN